MIQKKEAKESRMRKCILMRQGYCAVGLQHASGVISKA